MIPQTFGRLKEISKEIRATAPIARACIGSYPEKIERKLVRNLGGKGQDACIL